MMKLLRRLPGYYMAYRLVMRVAHRFDWHYMPKSYPDGDTMVWCQWCGVRDVIKRRGDLTPITVWEPQEMRSPPPPKVRD